MKETTIEIGGMSCNHCVQTVTRTLRGLRGVEVLNVAVGLATVGFDPSQTTPHAIAAAIRAVGFEPKGYP